MRKRNGFILAIITLLSVVFFSVAHADPIYKSVDAQGNVVFSDQPSSNAQQVTLPPISIAPAPTVVPLTPVTTTSTSPSADNPVLVYKQLDLLSPLNDQTIWDNNGIVNVSVALSPNLGSGDMLQVILDGKVVASSNSTTNFTLNGLDRGTHVMQVQIINSKKKVVKVSNVVTFYIHKAIAACNTPLKVCMKGNCQQELTYLGGHPICQQIFVDKVLLAESRYQTCKENACPQLAELKAKYETLKKSLVNKIQQDMAVLADNIEQCKAKNCSELGDLQKKYYIAEASILDFKLNQCERTHCKEKQELKNKYEAAKKQT